MNALEIGEFIRERRNNLKIQQQDLAEISGLSLRTIINVESGRGNPSLSTLERLTEVMGLELTLLVKSKS